VFFFLGGVKGADVKDFFVGRVGDSLISQGDHTQEEKYEAR
jgi:hypothetical protein